MRLHLFDQGHRPHLLIVSGSTILARTLAHGASADHFETSIATSRAEALQLKGNHEFAGYVIDANLPDASGAQLVRDLRDARITAPILFLNSLSDPSTTKNDADAALTKPVSLPEFRSLLQELYLSGDPSLNAPVSARRKKISVHLSTFLIPTLLGAGIAFTYWLLCLK